MIAIGTQYAWNLLAVTAMSVQCSMAGLSVAVARKSIGIEYPDMGSGRFSSKLTDEQWLEFNNVMRVHQNYVEGLPVATITTLVSGLFYPKLSAISGAVYILGRFIYGIGYANKGASGRMAGALILDAGLVTNLIASLVGIYHVLSKK
ncbi:Microsomal glutathione S-transferase 3 [Smittium culicis]|uniref:Microsomal glutathione S-transferase 3 n=1 Tax=Smittium culicis TaxID=133412 RepID=A0A1R1XKX9_9FUNG|nr:Microsomal glutathione S-transferase 3 [Smittium culicis]OMJ17990.1 Microsomal glutathione S-transferase 3 [Smittium culicis]